MTERYIGSIISPSPTEPSSNLSTATASGVWHLHDALIFGQAGDWPDPTNPPTVGLIAGGSSSGGNVNVIQKIVPESAGNATDFGDLSATKANLTASGNDIRFIAVGGGTGGSTRINVMEFVNYATAGDATDFGDMTESKDYVSCSSNNNRLLIMGGNLTGSGGRTNVIEAVQIQTTGNAFDWGDLQTGTTKEGNNGNIASTTRAIMAGGQTSSAQINNIQYMEFTSFGTQEDFGDLTATKRLTSGVSSNTRGVVAGGYDGSAAVNVIEYITIASTGNGTDFGDLTNSPYAPTALANSTTAIVSGGDADGGVNVIQSFVIATTGNATDFGDLLDTNKDLSSAGSGHASVQASSTYAYSVSSAGNLGLFVGDGAIQAIDITTTGDSVDFGFHHASRGGDLPDHASTGSSVRGLTAGTKTGSTFLDEINYINFHSRGRGIDFGNLSSTVAALSAGSNETRGIFYLGATGSADTTAINTIEYVTIASAGNTTDFGDKTLAKYLGEGVAGSTTRNIVFSGGGPEAARDVIEYITIASTGNATDFGDLTADRPYGSAVSSSTRAVYGGGENFNYDGSVMEYVTIASTGNASDFGDLSVARNQQLSGNISNTTRGIFGHGSRGAAGYTNTIDYITIASTGNASDFGDMTLISGELARIGSSMSNGHGGIDHSVYHATLPAAMGLIAGGNEPNNTTIAYINIASTSNEIQFGDLTSLRYRLSGVASATRCVWWGGYIGSNTAAMEFSTFSTKGIAQNFGNLTSLNNSSLGSVSNGTRGVLARGDVAASESNIIEYITIGTEGNSTDFGDLTLARNYGGGNGNSTTRGLFAGGFTGSAWSNVIDYVTIASTGNAQDFGDISTATYYAGGGGSSTRAVYGGGVTASADVNTIEYVTIASTGNATDFGDLTVARQTGTGSMSSSTRCVFRGENDVGDSQNVMDYITIASTGNATDFGDTIASRDQAGGVTSNSHGGIS